MMKAVFFRDNGQIPIFYHYHSKTACFKKQVFSGNESENIIVSTRTSLWYAHWDIVSYKYVVGHLLITSAFGLLWVCVLSTACVSIIIRNEDEGVYLYYCVVYSFQNNNKKPTCPKRVHELNYWQYQRQYYISQW